LSSDGRISSELQIGPAARHIGVALLEEEVAAAAVGERDNDSDLKNCSGRASVLCVGVEEGVFPLFCLDRGDVVVAVAVVVEEEGLGGDDGGVPEG